MCRRFHAFGVSMLVILQLAFATGASCGLTLCIEADGRSVIVGYQGDLYWINLGTGEPRQLTADGSISLPRWAR